MEEKKSKVENGERCRRERGEKEEASMHRWQISRVPMLIFCYLYLNTYTVHTQIDRYKACVCNQDS